MKRSLYAIAAPNQRARFQPSVQALSRLLLLVAAPPACTVEGVSDPALVGSNNAAGSSSSVAGGAGRAATDGTSGSGVSPGGSPADSGAGSPGDDGGEPGGDGGEPGGDGGEPGCRPTTPPACDAAPPDPGPARGFLQGTPLGGSDPRHRGRDQFLTAGDPQWLIAKFAYGLLDLPLTGEEVDLYLLRDCGAEWEKLGTSVTTNPDEHATVEGVEDSGGRVYFELPSERRLALGRHRVRFVVAGDLSAVEAFIEVVPRGTRVFVTDMDGTLTTDETAEFASLLTGTLPEANADASAALGALAAKGYRPLYLTARPEWLVERSREFLSKEGFPAGILHTTTSGTGASGSAAVTFKTAELDSLAKKELQPTYSFGNSNTDADAYDNANVEPLDHRIFYRYTDAAHSGRRIEAYSELASEFDALEPVCP